jgi:hypothetical protein
MLYIGATKSKVSHLERSFVPVRRVILCAEEKTLRIHWDQGYSDA